MDIPYYGKFGGQGRTAKLTEKDILEIRAKYHRCGYTKEQLAIEYSVSKNCIYKVVSRLTWKNVKED